MSHFFAPWFGHRQRIQIIIYSVAIVGLSFVLAITAAVAAFVYFGVSPQRMYVVGGLMLVPFWGSLGIVVGLRYLESFLSGACGAAHFFLYLLLPPLIGSFGVTLSMLLPAAALVWLFGHHPPIQERR